MRKAIVLVAAVLIGLGFLVGLAASREATNHQPDKVVAPSAPQGQLSPVQAGVTSQSHFPVSSPSGLPPLGGRGSCMGGAGPSEGNTVSGMGSC
jgi:hypothetical protein